MSNPTKHSAPIAAHSCDPKKSRLVVLIQVIAANHGGTQTPQKVRMRRKWTFQNGGKDYGQVAELFGLD